MREAVIVGAVRTPVGKGRPSGILAGWHPVDLLAATLRGLVERTGVDPARIDDVIGGCVSQVGEQALNVTRNAVLAAGLPQTLPATTVDRQCGSSQQAVHFAAQGVIAGAYDLVIATGVEVMSRVRLGSSYADASPFPPAIADRYGGRLVPQGISAELIAARWKLPRTRLDEFSVESHRRAQAATDSGAFDDEILALAGEDGTPGALTTDEGIRPGSTIEALAALPPAFRSEEAADRFPEIDWVIHAGNSSQISDGAAALLIAERDTAAALALPVLARLRAFAVVGDDPILMLTGVIPATRRVLERAGMGLDDIDLFEVNEAFAPVPLAWRDDLGADLDRVNVHGGAIALGHPLGASGARLMTTLVHAMRRRGAQVGLQTMCEGGGMANATILESVD